MNESIRSAHEIRRAFVDFFRKKDHTEVPGSALVPRNDPTLLFTSAGMVQFKDYYLTPENLPYTRAVSVQKCLRAGDLDLVGSTLRHHTFFEMLGNFSFGDYFKEEAILWAWEFFIDWLELPEDKLYVSIFEDDQEAFRIWSGNVGIEEKRIYHLGREDNFWGPVGKTGICGPCSEIYFDTGPERGCGRDSCAPGCDCDRYLEIWNLVFPQFFLEEGGKYRKLENPGIDTGLGLERLAFIMQDVEDNFHTDLFEPVVTGLRDQLPDDIDEVDRMSINMVADHLRALTFTIAEGVYPSNEGRGYLLRRLLRRALTRFHSLGLDKPFLHKLVDVVVDVMKIDYPELEERRRNVAMIIRSEEDNFFNTLAEGKKRFDEIAREIKEKGGNIVDGEKLFLLYDTFGVPPELSKSLAEKYELGVDHKGYQEAMERQRRSARTDSAFGGEKEEIVSMKEISSGESSVFIGYENIECTSAVRRYRIVNGTEDSETKNSDRGSIELELVLDKTPFYPTSGGQIADIGHITVGDREFVIKDVFKRGGEIVHVVEVPEEVAVVSDIIEKEKMVKVEIDSRRRNSIARNHTATHLLHAALRRVVGEHITQAGSLVADRRFRFDFNHFQPLSPRTVGMVEDCVNDWIRDCIPVEVSVMGIKEAMDSGATALFDEKYGEEVRVVRIGNISAELCGGTHVHNTGQLGLFMTISEGSAAAGTRRIEAVTGEAAVEYLRRLKKDREELEDILKVSGSEIKEKVLSLLHEIEDLKKYIRRLESDEVGSELDSLIESADKYDGLILVRGRLSVRSISAMRNQADIFRSKVPSGIAVLSAVVDQKLQFVVAATDDLIEEKGITATSVVDRLRNVTGIEGGGKRHLAQMGTKDVESESKIFEALPGIIKELNR